MKRPLLLMVTAVMLFFFPHANFAQPNLRTAGNFIFFSSIGAVSNAGVSQITGNVGSNSGAVSGFENLIGSIYHEDATTTQATNDLLLAYDELNNTPQTIFPAHGVILGNGEVLTAGVYSIPAAASLELMLTLDAAGDPNAVFIFKIGGAFSPGPDCRVALINGALAANVFWKVEGAVAMAAGTIMKGVVIANNAAVSMVAGGTLEGRLFSTTGAVSVDAVSAIPSEEPAVLPVKWLSFTGTCDKQQVLLTWSTETAINNNYFTVERSDNGRNWQVIGTVTEEGGLTVRHTYTFTDVLPGNVIGWYRIKQTDLNGHHTYGGIISVKICSDDAGDTVMLYPNPSGGKFDLLFTGDRDEVHSTEIFNSKGAKVYASTGLPLKFDLSNQTPGMYIIRILLHSKIIIRNMIVQ